jgi:hypothetical protein
VLKVFAVEIVRSRQTRRVNDHRIPKGNSIQPVHLDGRYHIAFHKSNDSGAREQLNLLLRRFRINAQFPGRRGKVLLQDLNRNNQQTGALIVSNELNCTRLLGWRRSIVSVYENVGVEDANRFIYRS